MNLGHVREVDIARLLDHGVTFSDLFDRREPLDNGCPSGFSGIKTDSGAECLAVKPGMEGPASRLETRRFAAMKGATTEFVRGGGLAYDSVRRLLYMAVGAVDGPMTDADPETMGGGPGANHIALPRNPCGAVYAFTLKAVAGIPSERVATRAQPVVMGTPAANAGDSAIDHNDCALEGIASPTGLAFIPEDDTLIIAEDTARGHQNDAVWAWDVGTASLSRVQTTPYGAAPAGTAWFPHMGDWGYLFSAVAHPYGDSNREKAVSPAARRAYLGYIGPFRGRLFN